MAEPRAATTEPARTGDPGAGRWLPLALAAAILGISSASILVRLLGDTGVGPWTVASFRMLYAALLLMPAVAWRAGNAPPRVRTSAGLVPVTGSLLAAAVLLAAHFATFTLALYQTTVARVVLLMATQSLFVLGLDTLWERRRPGAWTVACLVLALAGLTVMFRTDLGGGWGPGEWLGLASAATFACYLLVIRRLRRVMDVRRLNIPLYGLAGLLLLGMAWREEGLHGVLERRAQALFLGLAVLPTLCGHSLFHWCLRHTTSTVVSIAFLGEVVGATLLAWWLLGESLDPTTVLGGALALAGIAGVVAAGERAAA